LIREKVEQERAPRIDCVPAKRRTRCSKNP
jgi:hypothetical protein